MEKAETSTTSKHKNSLRKSSSDGLLKNFFRRSSSGKKNKGTPEKPSDGFGLSKSPTAEDLHDEKTNKAFRSGTGPLILVPQERNLEEKPKKPVHNVGIQQIPYQQAVKIFKDHKKLKEELFNEETTESSKLREKGSPRISKKSSTSASPTSVQEKPPKQDDDVKILVKPPIAVGVKQSIKVTEQKQEETKDNSAKKETGDIEKKKVPETSKERHLFRFKTSSKKTSKGLEGPQERGDKPVSSASLEHEDAKDSVARERHLFGFGGSDKNCARKTEEILPKEVVVTNAKKEDESKQKKNNSHSEARVIENKIGGGVTLGQKDLYCSTGSGSADKKEQTDLGKFQKDLHHFSFGIKDTKNSLEKSKEKLSPASGDRGVTSISSVEEFKEGDLCKEKKERNIFNFVLERKDCSKQAEATQSKKEKSLIFHKKSEAGGKQSKQTFHFSSGDKAELIKKKEGSDDLLDLRKSGGDKTHSPNAFDVYKLNPDFNLTKVGEKVKSTKAEEIPSLSNLTRVESQNFGKSLEISKQKETKSSIKELPSKGKPIFQTFDSSKVDKKEVPKQVDKNSKECINDREITKEVEEKKTKHILSFPTKGESGKETGISRLKDCPLSHKTNLEKTEETDSSQDKSEKHIFSSVPYLKSKPPIPVKQTTPSETKAVSSQFNAHSSINTQEKTVENGVNDSNSSQVTKQVKNTSKQTSQLSEEEKSKRQGVTSSQRKSNLDSKKSTQASAQSISNYTESLKEIISKEFPEEVVPLQIKSEESLDQPSSIKSDDKWYKDQQSRENISCSTTILQQKNIRENQEKKIFELHQKHLEEINKIRSFENVSKHEINSPVSPTKEAFSEISSRSAVADDASRHTDQQLNTSNFHSVATDTLGKDISGHNKQETLKNDYTNSSQNSVNERDPLSKNLLDNSTKLHPKKVIEPQQFSFSSYLTRSRKDSEGEKDKPQSKPEEKPPAKVDIPKKVRFPDELKKASNDQPPVDEKLSRAAITNQTQSAVDLADRDITSKVNTVSILKKPSSLKDDIKNDISQLTEELGSIFSPGTNEKAVLPPTISSPGKTTHSGPSFAFEEYQIPSRPPRGEKSAKRKRSRSACDDMRHQMSDQKVSKDGIHKDINQNRKTTPQGQAKSHPLPDQQPVQQSPQKNQHSDAVDRNGQQQDDSKREPREEKQEQRQPHHEKTTFTPESQNAERKEEGGPNPPKAPQPPSRGNKTKQQGAPHRSSSTEENKPEEILVTACKVAEEDQIMRLLRDLSKTCCFDAAFVNQSDKSGRVSKIFYIKGHFI